MRKFKDPPTSRGTASRVAKLAPTMQEMQQSFFVLTASKDHLDLGKKNGFIQQKRPHRIEKIHQGDYVVLYAGKAIYGSKEPYQKFVSVCQAVDDEYEKIPRHDGSGFFYRKKVNFLPFEEKEIRGIVPRLEFIKNKSHWGFYFMSGFMKINEADFKEIMK
jgi:predicted RNA-binding protein